MKTINVTFDEREFNFLLKVKKKQKWHDFIIDGAFLIRDEKKEVKK
jgi:hypothetical protein